MSEFNTLLFHRNLYPEEFITCWGTTSPHWRGESERKRELSLRHDMVCVLLCNLETNSLDQNIKNIENSFKRRWEEKSDRSGEPSIKRSRITSQSEASSSLMMEESMEDIVSRVLSSSSGEKSTNSDEITIENQEEIYRFILLEGMSNCAQLQNEFAKEWKCESPDSQWDIIDKKEKKFLEVKVTHDPRRAKETYYEKAHLLTGHASLAIIDPDTGIVDWIDHSGGVNGEEKVRKFLINRKQVMLELGIQDSSLHEVEDLSKTIFCCTKFNDHMTDWISSWWDLRNMSFDYEETLENYDKTLNLIDPSELYEKLIDNRKVENDFIKWRGKLIPEGLVMNYKTEDERDIDMVKGFLSSIEVSTQLRAVKLGYETIDYDYHPILNEICELGLNLDESSFKLGREACPSDLLCSLLGVGEKGRVFDPDNNCTVQPEYPNPQVRRYHSWFDMVLRKLNEPSQQVLDLKAIPFSSLYEKPIEFNHVMAKLSEETVEKLLTKMLCSNTAVYCSKLTNFYSRLGGAYLRRHTGKQIELSDIAMFPIYATLTTKDEGNEERKFRIVSGVVLRGPQHARNPTDRIGFITIEQLSDSKETRAMIGALNRAIVWKGRGSFYVLRQNSIMKEDPCYLMFVQNSLFVPMNFFGAITLENPYVMSNQNLEELFNQTIYKSGSWFCERFTEGVLSAAIGNSRDEGYFAGLRKLFMVVLGWKRNMVSASFDIDGLCQSVNECLIDNPLSMHFQNNLLDILAEYKKLSETGRLNLVNKHCI